MRSSTPLLVVTLMALTLAAPAFADDPPGTTRSHGGALLKTLPNGMKVIIIENHAAPVATVNTWFRVGARNELPQDEGISHFLEHMLFDGSEGTTLDEFNRFLFANAIDNNASTDQDNTNYYHIGPARALPDIMHMTALLVQKPVLEDEHFTREREVVKEELRQGLDNPSYFLWDLVLPAALSHTGYDHPVIGSAAILDAQTNDQMRQYYRDYYGPNNAFTVVIGDVDPVEALALVEKEYGDWQPVTIAPDPELKPFMQSEPRSVVGTRDFSTNYVMGVWPTVNAGAPETYALDLLASILGSGDSSRLAKRVKNELGLVSDVAAFTQHQMDTSVLGFTADLVDPAETTHAVEEVFAVIARLKAEGPTAAELERAKRALALSQQFLGEDIQNQAYTVGFYTTAAGSLEYFETYADHLYGVTAQDVQWAAQEYLKPSSLTLGLATPDTAATALQPDWSQLSAEGPMVGRPADLGRLGSNPFDGGSGDAAMPVERQLNPVRTLVHEASGAWVSTGNVPNLVQETLPNGVTLLINPAPSKGTVGISLAVRGGRHFEDWDSNGSIELLTRTIPKGTTQHSADELAELIEYLGGNLGVSAASDHLKIEGLFASLDLQAALNLIAELSSAATFPEDEVATERDLLIADIAARVDETQASTRDQLNFAMYGPDTAYGRPPLGRPSVIAALTTDDLKASYRRAFYPGNLVLAVAGDIDPVQVRAFANAAFGGLTGTLDDSHDGPAAPAFHPATGFQRIVDNRDKAQTMSVIGLPGVDLDDPDYPAVRVVNAVLGETWLSRLFDRLRGKEGLAYGTYSQVQAYPTIGAITAHIGSRPEMWEAAVAGLRREFNLIAKEGMTAEELTSALSYAQGNADIEHAGMAAQAAFLSLNVARNLPPDFEWQVLDQMLAIDLATANAAATKYFNADNAWLSVTGPIYGEAAELE